MTEKEEDTQSSEDEKQELIIVGSAEEIGYTLYQILTKGVYNKKEYKK